MKVNNKFKFNKSKELTKVLDKMPASIGNVSVRYFKQSFRSKSFDGHPWKQRKEEGKGSLMMVSGALKRSVKRTKLNSRMVTIVAGNSKVKYAAIHNEGGTINQKVTEKQKAFFRGRSKTSIVSVSNKWKAMSMSQELNIPIPKRQFMGESKALNRKVNKMILKKLNKVLK